MKTWALGRRWFGGVLGFGLGVAWVGAAEVTTTLKERFAVADGGRLVVRADRGNLEVTTSASNEVDIVVERTARGAKAEETLAAHQVTFGNTGNEVKVEGRWLNEVAARGKQGSLSVRYRLRIPRTFQVDARTAGGGITVEALDGEVRAETAGGSITLGETKGAVEAETAGGSIKVAGCGGKLKASTAGGSIKVERCAEEAQVETAGGQIELGEMGGAVTASASGGGIRIRSVKGDVKAATAGGGITVESAAGAVKAEATSGSIQVAFEGATFKGADLETAGGSITVTLPGEAAATVSAEAVGGRVSTELPVTVQGKAERDALRGTINGGGARLELAATAGSITIKKKR